MYCTSCGAQISDTAKFCAFCGVKVKTASLKAESTKIIRLCADEVPRIFAEQKSQPKVAPQLKTDGKVPTLQAAAGANPPKSSQQPHQAAAVKNYVGTKVTASYWRNAESVGGHLHFDEKGMTFKPHIFNFQREEVRIEYAQIRSIGRETGAFHADISLLTKDGARHNFIVYHRNELAAFLESRKTL